MGNIADALKKAGVGLSKESTSIDEQPGGVVIPAAEQEELTRESVHPEERADDEVSQVAPPASPSLHYGTWNERIQQVLDSGGPITEVFRTLRSKILYPSNGSQRPRTIMVASSAPEEGKSFVSINLGVTIAKGLDQYALLVDCDLRRPSMANLMGMGGQKTQGLTEYLQGQVALPEVIFKTTIDKLSILPSGISPENPAELLTSVRMSRLVNELSGRYSDRLIIFDSPPFQVASESLVLAQNVDGVILVVGYAKSNRARIKTMIDNIGKKKILGIVFNGQREGYIKKKMLDPYGDYYGKYYTSDNRRV